MENSKIEWTNHSWNPWYGCHKVSQGCENCYMYYEMGRYGKRPAVVQRSKTTFRAPLAWAKKGKPALVFTCSWSDFFIEEADEWRDEAWEIIRKTPCFTYQILTKRPENIAARLPADWGSGWGNVWLGVSAENQVAADRRIPLLLEIPCKTRFLSCEPLLDVVDFVFTHWHSCRQVAWVIAGGESGSDARPCHPDWVRALRDQCEQLGIPFFFKSWGEYMPLEPAIEQRSTLPVDYQKTGRKNSGRTLDGREWAQYPDGWET